MVKFRYLFVLSVLFFWLAGSGCVGNDTSNAKEAGIVPGISGADENTSAEPVLTEEEIQDFEKAFVEILIHKRVSPIQYKPLNLDKELKNA